VSDVRLKAPFPYFGGKSRVAPLVWDRFGDAPNYVEPFAGSLAVLLSRPHAPGTETVNDIDCLLSNFWRAIQHDPAAVAEWANWPVNEADLHARHLWLVTRAEFRERMKTDPDFYDAKVAGWWVWGACSWIGSGWCAAAARNAGMGINRQLPHVGDAGRGIHRKLPHVGNAGRGIHRKLPHVGDAGRGIHRKLPHVGNAGRGIHRKLPHVGDAGRGEQIAAYFEALSGRLRNVRVCCGEWDRVLGPSVTFRHGITAVFLDPPYAAEADRADNLYANDDEKVAHDVREWAITNGDNPELRIALCGYEGEHAMPETWECVPWKARGGYSSQSREGNDNPARERIWFSPACLRPKRDLPLFASLEATP
jgi:site-specific DNA-adenine methylase